MRSLAFPLIAGLALALTLPPIEVRADRLEAIKERGVIRIATVEQPPFLLRGGKSKRRRGFIPDLGGRLAANLGVRLEVKAAAPRRFSKMLRDGHADLVVGGFPLVDPAPLGIAFSPPVSRTRVELVTRRAAGTPRDRLVVATDAASLIAFVPATETPARAAFPGRRLWRVKSVPEVFQALALGAASAVVLGPPWSTLVLKRNPEAFVASDEPLADTEEAFATLASETELAEFLAQWVRTAEADGFLADRRRYWLESGDWLPLGSCDPAATHVLATTGAPARC